MTIRNQIRGIAYAALLTSIAAYAQFNSCTLVNNTLTTGSDPINYTRLDCRVSPGFPSPSEAMGT